MGNAYVLKYFRYVNTLRYAYIVHRTQSRMTVKSFCVVLQLSILVHPDKNQDDAERAQQAFES